MKKQYIIPSTTSVSFRSCSICSASPTISITGNTDLNIGGNTTTIEPM